jgi:hypothetical protein
MPFVPKSNWADAPSTTSPITAAELNRIEAGIAEGARDGTESVRGNLELATTGEMTTGTDTARVPSVARVAAYVTSAINTLSGSITTLLAGKSDTGHLHTSEISSAVNTHLAAAAHLTPPVTLQAPLATDVPLVVKGATSHTNDYFRADGASGTVYAGIDANGEIRSGINSNGLAAMIKTLCRASTRVGVLVKGATSQSANLYEARNSSDTIVFAVSASGSVTAPNIGVPLLVLDSGAVVPGGTLVGTVILRRPAP